jgi:16S rRNA (guanine527-N7)-methyltransferase
MERSSTNLKDLMKSLLQQWQIDASIETLERFDEYARLLIEKNSKINLIGNSDLEEVAVRHFVDSLSLVKMGIDMNSTAIDIGTGAGFPGIPIKILRPDVKLTLLDSLGKRLDFLKEVVDVLGLEDIMIVNARAEEAALLDSYREQYDYAFSRAVARMNMLSEICLPFVKCGGLLCAMKSLNIDEEIQGAQRAVKIMGGKIIDPYKYTLPLRDVQLQIVRIKKVAPTPTGYPRRFAKIKLKPL